MADNARTADDTDLFGVAITDAIASTPQLEDGEEADVS